MVLVSASAGASTGYPLSGTRSISFTMITRDQIVQWLSNTATVLAENKAYLTELDSAIGDADHGTNMDRGFKKVAEKLPSYADKDVGNVLKTTGMTLISSVGGASGPLYGTFFMRSGMAMASKESLTDDVLTRLLHASLDREPTDRETAGVQHILRTGRI